MQRLIREAPIILLTLLFTSCGSGGNSTPNPEITSIQPEKGPPGIAVTINGSGFSPEAANNTVTFGSTSASVNTANESSIKTQVPDELSEGSVQVSVTVGEQTATGPSFVVESQAPGISSIEPDSGVVGTEVTISGMNFSATASENSITFNGTSAAVKSATETELVADVPQGATDGPIEVAVGQKYTTGPNFDVITDGTLQAITETTGSDFDGNGYQLSLDGGNGLSIGINDTLYFNDLEAGSYDLELTDIAGNCSLSGSNSRTEDIIASDTTTTTFDVNCAATTSGKIVFSSTRDGDEEIYLMNPDGSNVQQLTDNSAGDFKPAISHDGKKIVFVSDRAGTGNNLYIVDATGNNLQQVTAFSDSTVQDPSWSPDDTQLVFTLDDQTQDPQIATINTDGTNLKQLTSDRDRAAGSPSWSPDGQKIVFHRAANFQGQRVIYTINTDGTDLNNLTAADNSYETEPIWSPDGTRILFRKSSDLWTMSPTGTDKTQLTTDPGKQELSPSWSPDGQKIAFELNNNIYVMEADGTGAATLIERSDVVNNYPFWGATAQ